MEDRTPNRYEQPASQRSLWLPWPLLIVVKLRDAWRDRQARRNYRRL